MFMCKKITEELNSGWNQIRQLWSTAHNQTSQS